MGDPIEAPPSEAMEINQDALDELGTASQAVPISDESGQNFAVISINELSTEIVINYIKSVTDKTELLHILQETRLALGCVDNSSSEESSSSKNSTKTDITSASKKRRYKSSNKSPKQITKKITILDPITQDILTKQSLESNPKINSEIAKAQNVSNIINNLSTKASTSNQQGVGTQSNLMSENVQFKDTVTPPDIVVRTGQKWSTTQSLLNENNISFKTAKTTLGGTKIKIASSDDYRKAIKVLKSKNIEFHTFMPANERDLHVVIRGVGFDLEGDELHQELTSLGFQPIKVSRMKHPRTRQEMPLFLVVLPKDDPKSKGIYNITEVCRLIITVEPLNKATEIGQCYRCLLFGHSSSRCTATMKCKNCAGDHDSRICTLAPNQPVRCANCGGPH